MNTYNKDKYIDYMIKETYNQKIININPANLFNLYRKTMIFLKNKKINLTNFLNFLRRKLNVICGKNFRSFQILKAIKIKIKKNINSNETCT